MSFLKKQINSCPLILGIVLFFFSGTFAHGDEYRYMRDLTGVSEQWHRIILPDDLFQNLTANQHDIRILGVSPDQDTIQIPYIHRVLKGEITIENRPFSLLNSSYNSSGYHYTFRVSDNQPINKILLEFERNNFDWMVSLSGSHDQQQWFTMAEDYRIVSFTNELTDYSFTDLVFQKSNYRYYRVTIQTEQDPLLISARTAFQTLSDQEKRDYSIEQMMVDHIEDSRKTELDIYLEHRVPVSDISILISSNNDYYRYTTIQLPRDHIETSQGMRTRYKTLATGFLSSLEDNEFMFSPTPTNRIRISIHNLDNPPLTIDSVIVSGYTHDLIARFPDNQFRYYLIYGNDSANKPQYDIHYFSDSIPALLPVLALGQEQILTKEVVLAPPGPLISSHVWLWAVLLLIIILLGWFTITMMQRARI